MSKWKTHNHTLSNTVEVDRASNTVVAITWDLNKIQSRTTLLGREKWREKKVLKGASTAMVRAWARNHREFSISPAHITQMEKDALSKHSG